MIIKKVLNNNVVVSTDDKGNEIIVRGLGLAFQKKKGEEIDKDKIEKIYILSDDHNLVRKFQELIKQIDERYIQICDDAIELAKKENLDISNQIYLNLPDHLQNAVQRLDEGVIVRNSALLEIKRFYPVEYQIAIQILRLVEDQIGVILPLDEAGFVAMHLINLSYGNTNREMDRVIEILTAIEELLIEFIPNLPKDSLVYDRFLTHLKYFAMRIVKNEHPKVIDDADLLDLVQNKYKVPYQIAGKIANLIEDNYGYQVNSEEKVYLTIHLAKLLKN